MVAQGKQWIKQLPWKPEEVVMIGDTLHDLEVVEAIGADRILLATVTTRWNALWLRVSELSTHWES